ncbi:MAG: DNA-3-methyladenine glycosylase [Candidatus Marinimicrobia bacterium]|nr:DNA-3-methyladenine glycosylase [Candidatus Neomarinimicrobiota bacterium]MCF7921985.1 DNA-3-methyladenine glycosylase [Candidatus Neomarinimicrobiota bacterium]
MTDHLSSQIALACQRLSESDPRLKTLIETFGPPGLERGGDPYQALVRSIIYQQISGKAARSIFNRFLAIFPGSKFPTPQELSAADLPGLRMAGLSQRKAEYVTGIGAAFLDPHFLSDRIDDLSDRQVSEKLTGLRGVGQWTADMFMIFTLARLDVLPLNDQGILNGMQVFFELDHLPAAEEMVELTEHWKPYRSIASWYMWKVVDEDFQWQ